MKKTIIFSVLVTGVIGYAAWQYHQGKQDGAGETRPVALPQVTPVTTRPETDLIAAVAEQAITEKVAATEALMKSEADDDTTAKFVASGKPGQIIQYYAERRRARAELVINQMHAEVANAQWSDELRERFAFAISMLPNLPDMQLAEADCRQTICALHIQLANENVKQLRPFMQHIGIALGSDTFVHHDANPGEAIVYVAKAETLLPDLEAQPQ